MGFRWGRQQEALVCGLPKSLLMLGGTVRCVGVDMCMRVGVCVWVYGVGAWVGLDGVEPVDTRGRMWVCGRVNRWRRGRVGYYGISPLLYIHRRLRGNAMVI